MQDLLVIGGGVNGAAIARDAAGRGLSVTLVEMGDIGGATSSASTKLFHGGLRYLEYFELKLVRESLIERERLLAAMPHISWPMRFILPYHKEMRFDTSTPASKLLGTFFPWLKGRRPAWIIRFGLFLYDSMGGRKILPATSRLNLRNTPEGSVLKPHFEKAYEYSDCWVEDSRLVLLNVRDAAARGTEVLTRSKVVSAERLDSHWVVIIRDIRSGKEVTRKAKVLVNAAGPWVEDVLGRGLRVNTAEKVRLVRGSHIVTRKLYDHDKCYFLQGRDGRIIFAIPYEREFTLIGTTDQAHDNADEKPECTDVEKDYLLDFVSEYFAEPITRDDVVWSYAGVRPLYDDGANSASAATRDFVLSLNAKAGAPVLSVFGGKITSHRHLAEEAMDDLRVYFPQAGAAWTAGVPMPGGDFEVSQVGERIDDLCKSYPFLDVDWATRLFRAYGNETWQVLGDAKSTADLGQNFGEGIFALELDWAIDREYVETAEDFVWRRTRLGLRLNEAQIAQIDAYIKRSISDGQN